MVRVYANPLAVASAAAGMFIEQFEMTLSGMKKFSVVLSGGHTPALTYELLATEPFRSQIDWSRVHVFWGDERCVAATDMRSNYHMAYQALLSKVPIPAQQIHPMFDANDPEHSAINYEADLRRFFKDTPPLFDLVILGLGKDGHTASLFPGAPALNEKDRWVVQTQNAEEDFTRVTLTVHLLNQTQTALFLVTGSEKKEILKRVLYGDSSDHSLPVQLIHPATGKTVWLVDKDASGSSSVELF